MSNGVLYYNNIATDNSQLTVDSEKVTFEKNFLIDRYQTTLWSSDGIPASSSVLFSFASPVNILGCYIGGTNIQVGDTTFELQGGTTAATTDFSIDLKTNLATMPNGIGNTTYVELNQTYQYWKIYIVRAISADSTIGKIGLFSNSYTFEKNYRWRRKTGYSAIYSEATSYINTIRKDYRMMKRIEEMSFNFVTQTQKDKFDEEIRKETEIMFVDKIQLRSYYGHVSFEVPDAEHGYKYSLAGRFEEMI